jgi:hypothetical protein
VISSVRCGIDSRPVGHASFRCIGFPKQPLDTGEQLRHVSATSYGFGKRDPAGFGAFPAAPQSGKGAEWLRHPFEKRRHHTQSRVIVLSGVAIRSLAARYAASTL